MRPLSRFADHWQPPTLFLVAVVAFFLWKGLPAPDVDDLFFLGAPLHLTHSGELVNPLLRRWTAGFGTEKYYLQMPLHPYLLAAWLRIFGVSVPAVLGFSWACYGLGAAGLDAWLRRFGWRAADVLWLLPIYLTLMLWLCQRPDVAAFALLFAGLGVLDLRPAVRFWRGWLGFVLLGASILCYPMTVCWAIPLVLAEIFRAADGDPSTPTRLAGRWLPALGLAIVCVGGLFVTLVHGDVREFLRVFEAHRALRAAPSLPALAKSLLAANKDSLALPVFVLYPAVVAWAALRRTLPIRVRALVLGTAAGAFAGVGVYYAVDARVGIILGFFIGSVTLAGACLQRSGQRWVRLGLYGIFGGAGAVWFVQTALQHAPAAPALAEAHRHWDAAGADRTRFLDAAAARYLFDYDLPPDALDMFYAVPPPGAMVVYVPGDHATLWAGAHPWMRYIQGAPPALTDYPKYTFRGHPLDTLPREPYEIVVVGDR